MRETISHTIIDIAERHSHRTAYQIREGRKAFKRTLYKDVYLQARQIASFLNKNDTTSQEPVGIYAPNSPNWAIAFAGIMLNNGIAVPIDCNSGSAELQHIIHDTGIKCVFTAKSHILRLAPFNLQSIVIMDENDCCDLDYSGRLYSLSEISKCPPDDWTLPPVKKQDVSVIIYTSGTTAAPKGVMLTHEGLLANVHAIIHALDITGDDHFLSVLGLSHTFELSCGLILPLCVGACVTYNRSLKYTTVFNDMALARPTVMLAVPLLFEILLKHAIERASSTRGEGRIDADRNRQEEDIAIENARMIFGGVLRFCICGGAPLATSLIKGYREIGIPMLQVYGLTEVSGVATLTTSNTTNPNSVGKPLPHVEIKIEAAKEAAVGEICIRGPSMMAGYNNNPQATADCIRNAWLYTGDIGHLDKKGNLSICGRSKNVIVTNAGVNVHPEELEQRIQTSKFVAEVCVIGKLRPDGTETVQAVVVPDRTAYEDYLAGHIAEKRPTHELNELIWAETTEQTSDLASYKKIHSIQLRNKSLPRGRTRKILREQVCREINAGRDHP